MAPTPILPGRTYIHISSQRPPTELALSAPGVHFTYRGPVGELDGEHVFEVEKDGQAVEPEGDFWKRQAGDVVGAVKRSEGVQGATLLVPKQRAKRDEF